MSEAARRSSFSVTCPMSCCSAVLYPGMLYLHDPAANVEHSRVMK